MQPDLSLPVNSRTEQAADHTLVNLVLAIAALNVLHLLDHVLRGDFHWPIDEQSVGFMIVAATILGGIWLGLWLYRSGRVGPQFWSIVGTLGLGLGWFSHFSPTTDQPLSHIYSTYPSSAAGVLAVACFLALMLAVLLATVYAGYLWLGRPRP